MALEQQLRAFGPDPQDDREREKGKEGWREWERQRQRKRLAFAWAFETLKPIPCYTLPPTSPHLWILPNILSWAYGGHFPSDHHSFIVSTTVSLLRASHGETVSEDQSFLSGIIVPKPYTWFGSDRTEQTPRLLHIIIFNMLSCSELFISLVEWNSFVISEWSHS